ncbi:MAG: cyclophilin-like family protein [Archaeoglobaceae archaeon]
MILLIKMAEVECLVEIDEKLAPKTVEAIKNSLPIKSYANRWGDEVYFETNVDVEFEENQKDVVEIGEVAFWIPGRAICIFFGKTPISDDKIRPASAVNVFGKVIRGLENLKKVKDGDEVLVTSL